MDFLDPKKKRAHQRRLYIGYGLVAIALGIATTILVFAASGYGVNRKTGQIIQNGLVFVDSHPDSSTIYINGVERGQTDSRYVLEEGKYTLELKRDGYQTWKRDFVMEGGSVERFVYPFLFPIDMKRKDVQLFSATPDVVTVSPDRHWIISHQPNDFTTFNITDTSTKDNLTTAVKIPASVVESKPNQKLSFVEWSTDNRHLLLKRTFDGGQDFIMFDRDSPDKSVNMSQQFEGASTQITLRDKKADQFYVFDQASGQLSSAQTGSPALTPVASKVVTFWPYLDDTVLYVTADGAPSGKVIVKLLQGAKTYPLRELPVSPVYLLNIASFDSQLYVAAGSQTEGKVYVYKNPIAELKQSGKQYPSARILLKANAPEYVSFSANARFIGVQGGSSFAIYDAEANRQYRYDTKLPLDAHQKAVWMDGHRLLLISNQKQMVFDFDGTNMHDLGAVVPGFEPMFDRDFTALFTISPSKDVTGRTSILRTELKLTNVK